VRVCFLAGTLGQGGAEQQLYYMVRSLHECGTTVRVLSLTQGEFWEAPIRRLGVPVTWVGRSRSRLARLHAVVEDLRRSPVDIIQSQHFYTTPYATAAARLLGIREIGAIRCDVLTEQRDNGPVLARLSLLARTIAVNSEAGIQNAVSIGVPRSRLVLLPNVVDTVHFAPAARSDSAYVTLLLMGRLTAQKRVDRFLSVLSTLKQRSSRPIRGLVIGKGPERQRLEHQAAAMGLLPDTVEFRGAVPATSATYQQGDILLLTSDYEGTPNVVMEAMACGLPVVSTRVGDVPRLIHHEDTGYLVERGDERALTNLALRLIDNSTLRREIGTRARQYVERQYSVQRLSQTLLNLYDAVLTSSRTPRASSRLSH
jgi:glycosyltransferase involved in cell wall biosynthesis